MKVDTKIQNSAHVKGTHQNNSYTSAENPSLTSLLHDVQVIPIGETSLNLGKNVVPGNTHRHTH